MAESNPGPLAFESDVLPTALHGPIRGSIDFVFIGTCISIVKYFYFYLRDWQTQILTMAPYMYQGHALPCMMAHFMLGS